MSAERVYPRAADDASSMRLALALAARGLGSVWPNPAVGCVLVAGGRIVGRGWTQPGGRPHAETEALARAGEAARGATAYVTLEPCAHRGLTGPCAEALVAAGIARVVVAVEDPDPRVNGKGLALLRAAGVDVAVGILRDEAAALNEGFFRRVRDGRPMFTLKLATSLDGRIAAPGGDSKWITGDAARARAHALRASHDGILVGAETALADDPDLTCRLPGMAHRSPLRLVADSRLRLAPDSRLARTARAFRTWALTVPGADGGRRAALEAAGVEVLDVAEGPHGRPQPEAIAATLAARGLTRVLVEGGGTIAASFLRAGLVDRVAWFTAPKVLGADGVPAVGPLGLTRVADAPAFVVGDLRSIGGDVRLTGKRRT